MRTKKFDIEDVLSITTGRLVSQRRMDGVYDILNFMTGDNLFTHQLPRAVEECAPYLLQWFPELAEAGKPENLAKLDELIDNAKDRNEPLESAVRMWLEWMTGKCKLQKEYDVKYIPLEAHQIKDPVEELSEMVGPEKIVVVELD